MTCLAEMLCFVVLGGISVVDIRSRKMTAALQYDDPYLSNLPQDKLTVSVTMQSIAENEKKTISTLTLAVNDQQAAALAGLNQAARLHAALVMRGDEAYKQTVLAAQNDYFQGLRPVEVSDTESEAATAVSTVMTTE